MIAIGHAIDKRNIKEIQRVCGKDKSLWEQASDHVVDTEDVDFIANFLMISILVTGYALLTLCRRHEIIDSVVEKVGISFAHLGMKAARADPILSLEKFMRLLNRMLMGDGLERFMECSTRYLFIAGRTDLIYSRLDALENDKTLHAVARWLQIIVAFLFGARYQDQGWIERLYDYPMICEYYYAEALIMAGGKGINNKIFKRLLEEADKRDLQVTQNHAKYTNQSEEFRAAIKGVFSTAKPGWARVDFPHKRVTLQKSSLKIIQNLEYSKKSLISLLLMLSTIPTITMGKEPILPRELLIKSSVPLLKHMELVYLSLAMWVWMRKTWWMHEH